MGKDTRFGSADGPDPVESGKKGGKAKKGLKKILTDYMDEKPEDMKTIIDEVLKQAKNGELKAATFLLDRYLPKDTSLDITSNGDSVGFNISLAKPKNDTVDDGEDDG